MKMFPKYIRQIAVSSILKVPFIRRFDFPEYFLFFNSGRGTAKWLFSQLKLIKKRELRIGIPCYACYTVYQSVYESNNIPVLLDINPLSFSFTSELDEHIKQLDVLLWINYFGFRYDNITKEIRTKYPDLIIVEDCAHVDLRDYLKIYNKECHYDYAIFSSNVDKPITAAGGGLLIPNMNNDAKVAKYLCHSFNQLPYEKLNVFKIIRIFKYTFYLVNLLLLFFYKPNSRKGNQTFNPQEVPIKSLLMNRVLKKLFCAQFSQKSGKKKSETYTLNYFDNKPYLMENYSFGSLSYFPVILCPGDNITMKNNIDKFMLWGNLIERYKYFGVDISEEDFPMTFNFLSKSIFLPAKHFINPDNGKIVSPFCLK